MQHLLLNASMDIVGLLFVVGTLPLLLELLLLTVAAVLPPRRINQGEGQLEPIRKLTVVIPCHNEEIYISRCLESILLSGGGDVDVLVVAHNCTDGTSKLAVSFPQVRVAVLNDETRRGKGFALEEGFRLAFEEGNSDAVLVIDADSVVSQNLIPSVRHGLSNCQLLQCQYEVKNSNSGWRTGILALAMQAMNIVRPKGRARLSLSCGIFGNGFALRKSVLGVVRYNSYSIVEDLEFHLSLVEHGYQVKFIDGAKVSADMPVEESAASTQRARWEGGRLRMIRTTGMKLVQRVCTGKFEFFEPLLDLLSMPLAFAIVLMLPLLLIPGSFFHGYVICAFLIILFHLYAAARIGPDFMGSLRALLFVPFYVAWKMTMLSPIIRASQNGAEWVRTRRGTSRQ